MAKKAKKYAKPAKKAAKPSAKKKPVLPIPKGFHTVTPHIVVKGASDAIELYKKAFGAKERFRMPTPDGRIMHAEIQIGSSIMMLGDEMPEHGVVGPVPGTKPYAGFYLYVPDCDRTMAQATSAGCTVIQAAQDMFWGDRYGTVQDPFGHYWSIGTHKRDVSPAEMAKAAQEAMKPPAESVPAPAPAG